VSILSAYLGNEKGVVRKFEAGGFFSMRGHCIPEKFRFVGVELLSGEQ